MKYSPFSESKSQKVIDLFKVVFSESEGEAEGQTIGKFVSKLITTTEPQDLIGFIVEDNEEVVGCVFFSRLIVPDGQVSFILSPVAISTDIQGKGIGQELINTGLEYLRTNNATLVFTYGDPSYYSKTGFNQINENIVKAPCRLSQPIGWLVQSLDGKPILTMSGSTRCVEALNDPTLW